jgi:SAM-dependent methyltransferase
MENHRLNRRHLRIWQRDFLINRHTWANIKDAIQLARNHAATVCPVVLDVGCGHKPYLDWFGSAQYFGMDRSTTDTSPDFLGDACKLPIQSGVADIVFSTQVIEHVPNPHEMINEFHRVLKPNGSLILSGPLYWPLHEEPFDFFRFTKHGFALLLGNAGFSQWTIKEDGGDWTQLMLALNLKMTNPFTLPIRCAVNAAGMFLDSVSTAKNSPANYTILARRS